MKKWEYKILFGGKSQTFKGATPDKDNLEKSFNELGKEGWEYQRSENSLTNGWTEQILFIFRRELV